MQNTVILIPNDGMGQTDLQLQHTLIAKYFDLLLVSGDLPNALCFYTAGVKLTVAGSPVLAQLAALEQKGVRLDGETLNDANQPFPHPGVLQVGKRRFIRVVG